MPRKRQTPGPRHLRLLESGRSEEELVELPYFRRRRGYLNNRRLAFKEGRRDEHPPRQGGCKGYRETAPRSKICGIPMKKCLPRGSSSVSVVLLQPRKLLRTAGEGYCTGREGRHQGDGEIQRRAGDGTRGCLTGGRGLEGKGGEGGVALPSHPV